MPDYFSAKLRQLRQSRDLTQEQAAAIFNVSPQSVSRWETGANYPDVELLPHIAIYFGVTIDELLGTEAIRGEEKAQEHIKDIRELLNRGSLQEALDTARRAAREFPLNAKMQYLLLQTLCTEYSRAESEDVKNEILALGEKIEENDDQQYYDHKFLLIRHYARWGMKENAAKIVYTLPQDAYHTQDLTLGYVLEGDKWLQNQKLQIVRFTIMLCDLIGALGSHADTGLMQKIECLKAAIQIEAIAYPLAGEQSDTVWRAQQHINAAQLQCEAKDCGGALDSIEAAARDAVNHIKVMYETDKDGSNYFAFASRRNLCAVLLEDYLEKPQFDIVRGDGKFIECVQLLKANAGELA